MTKTNEKQSAKVHTLVGHLRPDLECCMGLYAMRHLAAFRERLNVADDAVVRFIPAGPLDDAGREAIGAPKGVSAEELEVKHGFRFFDCGGGQFDQHGQLDVLQQNFSSLDLMVIATDVKDDLTFSATVKYLFDLVSKNDLTAAEIVRDTNAAASPWPHTQQTLRNLNAGLNLVHAKRPDVVVQVMDIAIGGAIHHARAEAARTSRCGFTGLFDLPLGQAERIARESFLVPNILMGAAEMDMDAAVYLEREVKAAFDCYEAEWLTAVRDYQHPKKTQVFTGIPLLGTDGDGRRITTPATVAVIISDSERAGAVCRKGYLDKARPQFSRRPADVVIQFSETNQRRFVISTSKKVPLKLNWVAAALRAADAGVKGVRGITAVHVQQMTQPGHGSVRLPNGQKLELLYFAEFETAFGHLRSNPHAEATALLKREVVDITIRALTEGLSRGLVRDVLNARPRAPRRG